MTFLTASTAARPAVSALHGAPVPRVRIDLEALPCAVAGHAYITVAVAGLTCLQVPSRLQSMVCRPHMLGKQTSRMASLTLGWIERSMGRARTSCLEVRPCPSVRLHPEVFPLELGMTLGTIPGVVTLIAALRIVQHLNGMDLPEIGSMGFGDVAGDIIRNAQIRRDAAAFVTIEAELLVVTINAVLSRPACEKTMLPHLVRAVGGSDA